MSRPASRLSRTGPRRSRGQVLVWFLATLAASAAVLYGVYNVGQVTVAKQKVVNAVDAGALAGAVQEARLLNLMAYGNRSMLVSDALVAQMVSLDSWLRYVQVTNRNLEVVTQAIPWVGQALSRVFAAVEKTIDGVEETYGGKFLPATIQALGMVKQSIEAAQEGIRWGGAIVAQNVSAQVIRANKTDFGGRTDQSPQWGAEQTIFDGRNAVQWFNFSRQYSGGERANAAYVVRESRDDFSREEGRPGNALMNAELLLVKMQKRGGTRLMGFDLVFQRSLI